MLSAKQGGIKYHFESLVWLNLGLNTGLLDQMANTTQSLFLGYS